MTTLPEHTMHAVADAAESLDVLLEVTPDPTGSTPAFALTLAGDYAVDDDAFAAGVWAAGSAWDPDTHRVEATTPTIGAQDAATLVLTRGRSHWLWCRLEVGGETMLRRAAVIVCP